MWEKIEAIMLLIFFVIWSLGWLTTYMQQTVYGNGGASNARKTKDLRERGDKKDVLGKKYRTGIRCKALHFKCHAGENRVLA